MSVTLFGSSNFAEKKSSLNEVIIRWVLTHHDSVPIRRSNNFDIERYGHIENGI